MKLSIAIPTYECGGRGNEFLDDLLRTIEIQTFNDFEVVISDHSVDDKLLETIDEFKDKFKIVYIKNSKDIGNSPSNLNNAIKNCSGEIIKIMFQDDFFYDDESLEKIYNAFGLNDYWLVCGSNHTNNDGNSFHWDFYPKWNDNILDGVNTISSPSVVSAKKEVFDRVYYDTNLVMMMDCEFYYHTKKLYGDPIYYDDILVSNRIHNNQISSSYMKNNYEKKINDEILYCKKKHRII